MRTKHKIEPRQKFEAHWNTLNIYFEIKKEFFFKKLTQPTIVVSTLRGFITDQGVSFQQHYANIYSDNYRSLENKQTGVILLSSVTIEKHNPPRIFMLLFINKNFNCI